MHRTRELWSVLRATARRELTLTVGLLAAIVLSVVLGLLPPLVLQRAIDGLAQGNAEPNSLLALACIYVGITFAAGLAQFSRESAITAFGERFTHAMRSHMVQKLGKLPTSYFSSHGAGETTSLLVNDVDTLEALFSSGIVSLLADACSLVGIVIVVFTRCVGLGLLLLVALPAVFAWTLHVQRGTRVAQAARRQAVADANQAVPDTMRCLRVIRILGRQAHMRQLYDAIVERGFAAMERSNFYDSVYSPVVITTSAAVTGVALTLATLGGTWASLFGMTAGTAVAMIAYVNQVFMPISDIGMEIQTIQSAGAGLDRIRTFLAENEARVKTQAQAGTTQAAICISHVAFSYRADEPILTDTTLAIAPGEVVTIEGRTGAGKSTIFSLLLGLYQPESGTVRVLGQDPCNIPASQRRHVFGYVPQAFFPLAGSVAENITLRDPGVTPEQVSDALQLAGLTEAVASLPHGVETPLSAANFSQGQLQLLSIARAVACDPQVLLLDETNANLDSATEQQVMDALTHASQGRTVLSISHRTSGFLGGRRMRLDGGVLMNC